MDLRYERKKTNTEAFFDAKIIWHGKETETYYETPKNSYCLFRKEFYVDADVEKAELKIFADSRYVVYLNGEKIGRGPCRSDPRWQYYDTYSIGNDIVSGKNVLSVEVLYYGYGTGHSICRIPALVAESSITFKNGEKQILSTDKTWKTRLSEALDRNAPRVNGCKSCIEIWDKRKELDFTALDFDDSDWELAKERGLTLSPFWNVCPKPIENLEEEYIRCEAVVSSGKGEAANAENEVHKGIKAEMDKLAAPVFCNVSGDGSDTVYDAVGSDEFNYCVLDFKSVWAGYISIELTGADSDVVDVVYSEALLNGKPVFDNVSYRPVSRFILKEGLNRLETKFNYEAFRYVYLIFRNHKRKIVLKKAGMIARMYPLDEVSSFETENEKLQKIWDISTHTLKLCMQDGFLDSPSREQQQWMGDGRFQAIMNYYYSGDCKMHEKLLLQIAQSQDFEGMTCSRYPDANHNWPPIPSFCLQWVSSFGDYYTFTKKTELIAMLWNSVISAMRWFSAYENARGLLENVRYWQYYDLSKNDEGWDMNCSLAAPNAFINLMYAEAMKTVIDLAKVLKDHETEAFFSAKFKRLREGITEEFWSDRIGAYSLYKGKDSIAEAVNALAIIVLHNKEDAKALKILSTVFDAKTRVSGVYKVSPYFMIPFYRAMNKMGRNDIALSETVERYSLMLESGATSTWEHWKLVEGDFMHSACHAWAASPIVLIAENLLGIDASESKGEPASLLSELKNFSAKIVTPDRIHRILSNENGVQFNEKNRI